MRRRIALGAAVVVIVLVGIWQPLSDQPTPAPAPATPAFMLPTRASLPDACGAAPPARLAANMQAHVARPTEDSGVRRNLIVRAAPGGEPVGLMTPGTSFRITGDYQCTADGLRWWPVLTLDGALTGWSVEGFAPDDYMMMPGG